HLITGFKLPSETDTAIFRKLVCIFFENNEEWSVNNGDTMFTKHENKIKSAFSLKFVQSRRKNFTLEIAKDSLGELCREERYLLTQNGYTFNKIKVGKSFHYSILTKPLFSNENEQNLETTSVENQPSFSTVNSDSSKNEDDHFCNFSKTSKNKKTKKILDDSLDGPGHEDSDKENDEAIYVGVLHKRGNSNISINQL
ncbi:unnamed protein product, partial [Brachionus calyciflorus]